MKKHFNVLDGYSVPVQAPLVNQTCLPPFECLDSKNITVFFRANPDAIRAYLANTPFDYYSDVMYAYVADCNNATCGDGVESGFWDSGVVIPVMYKGRPGMHVLFEYEDKDWAIASGRELWGYPKKYADVSIQEMENKYIGNVRKHKTDLIHIELDLASPLDISLARPVMYPHFQIKVMPKPDGPGVEYRKILSRDPSPDFIRTRYAEGQANVQFKNLPYNELEDFTPVEILGGCLTIGNVFATERCGWPTVEEVLEY